MLSPRSRATVDEELSKMGRGERAMAILLAKIELPNLRQRLLEAQTEKKRKKYEIQIAINEYISQAPPP